MMIKRLEFHNLDHQRGWIDTIYNKHGHLDGAVNLASVTRPQYVPQQTTKNMEREWNRIIAFDLTTVMHCLQAQMKVVADGGSIVNVTRATDFITAENRVPYMASKHGVFGLTKSAAYEMWKRKVRVNAINP